MQNSNVMLFRHSKTFRRRFIPSGKNQRGHFIRQKTVENDGSVLTIQFLQVGIFHRTEDVDPHRLKMVKEARDLQTGAADIVHRDLHVFIIRSNIHRDKVELLNQLAQGNRINICHDITS